MTLHPLVTPTSYRMHNNNISSIDESVAPSTDGIKDGITCIEVTTVQYMSAISKKAINKN